MSRFFPIFSLSILFLAPLAGCVGGADETGLQPSTETKQTPEEGDASQWQATIHDTAEILLGAGHPFGPRPGTAMVEGCEFVIVELPSQTSEAEFTVSSEAVNTSQPGVGFGTFKVGHEDEDELQGPSGDGRPASERSLTLKDPRAGNWTVWIFPWGPAVNQVYHVDVTMKGAGASPDRAPQFHPSFCSSDTGLEGHGKARSVAVSSPPG